jgi:hypothetical protein
LPHEGTGTGEARLSADDLVLEPVRLGHLAPAQASVETPVGTVLLRWLADGSVHVDAQQPLRLSPRNLT